ncbi:putative LRR receptor-like serine/threonine-protein kinase, partial [Trifolium medium]|nr:putative LRR receptor-like serine/threonine-protein kinase [Trifolium medium]
MNFNLISIFVPLAFFKPLGYHRVSSPTLQSFRLNCNTSLDNKAHCAICTSKRSEVFTTYLTGIVPDNVSDCRSYTAIYADSLSDDFGPTNPGTAKCLFGPDFTSSGALLWGLVLVHELYFGLHIQFLH